MSCPHTQTTAVLAAFGEAPADFEAHLQVCADCQTAVDAHTQTLAVLAPVAPSVARSRPRPWRSGVTMLLLAAAALLAIRTLSPEVDPDRLALDSPVPEVHHTAALTLSFESDLDSDLSDLELELAMISLE
jgi:hypothetical protein